jgi:hypothetical protein
MSGLRRVEKPIPPDADPAIRFILQAVRADPRPYPTMMLEADANLGHDTVRRWLYRDRNAKIRTVRSALRALGYDLAIVPFDETAPVPPG